jgi:SAM-dependent methyltransferase
VREAPAQGFAAGLEGAADLVFVSNLLEHLPSKAAVVDALRECRRALRPDGRLVVLQPNIRHVGAAYWDYFDHQLALTDRSVAEALGLAGFEGWSSASASCRIPSPPSAACPPPGWTAGAAYLRLRSSGACSARRACSWPGRG